jgi:hypothetical protein
MEKESDSSNSEGTAGKSARDEYQKRVASTEKKRIRVFGPKIGKFLNLVIADSQSTSAWDKGNQGEVAVGIFLDRYSNESGFFALHDRQIPRSKANIDHILITDRGVFVIDAKNYKGVVKIGSNKEGKKVLRVGGYDRTNLAEKLKIYSEKVRESLEAAGIEVKVVPLLAFYKATFQKDSPVSINGVIVNFHGIENELFRNAKIKLTGEHPSIIASKILEDFPEKDA